MEDKQQLEEQMRAVMDKYKYKRRQIRELQEDLQVIIYHLSYTFLDDLQLILLKKIRSITYAYWVVRFLTLSIFLS